MIAALFLALALQQTPPAPAAVEDLRPIVLAGQAEVVRRYPAPEAGQGVAATADALFAVNNATLARYNKVTGEREAIWTGDRARFPHINSCAAIAGELVCGASNFPGVPHWSAVEIFDPATLEHRRTISLGLGTGSLTWVDRRDGAWWAMFANYSQRGGEPPRDHRSTTLVKFDDQWRRLESWSLPASVLERMAPTSSSGGGWGPDGRLYITGHDRPELYVLTLPAGGAVLDHVATIGIAAEGQAIDWDESEPGMLYGISRHGREMIAMRVPMVP
ncbi:hypothetical protein [Brevundimonas variabilis]|uniref:SMP-30/Gluconolactonase/LRE-like region domain-containing protein n=1 Tax=Brevundimonas variabilis TaxID=74312 RepID=A0A7W9CJ84_9CAUL|nr:hypothetical protein [Brevundimonas variabilis]MBB5746466.1 hypothetical protein [Brevundimonas variabilis]